MQIDHLNKVCPLSPNDRVVALVSGGVDSMVLLHQLSLLSHEIGFSVEVLHVNYHLRGPESDRDANFVANICAKYRVLCHVIDAPLQKESGIQNRARNIRYNKVSEMAIAHTWTKAFTAHHANDQLETILMRLMRGTNVRGLRGILPVLKLNSQLTLIRPFLASKRKEIETYAHDNNIGFVLDSSNLKTDYLRNKVRKVLTEDFDFDKILKLADSSHQNYQKALSDSDLFKKQGLVKNEDNLHWYDSKKYQFLNQSARFLFIEEQLKGNGFKEQVCTVHLNEIDQLVKGNKSLVRPYGSCEFILSPPLISFRNHKPDLNWKGEHFGSGKLLVDPFSWTIQVEETLFDKNNFSLSDPGKRQLYIKKPTVPISFRFLKYGDRFHPIGRPGSKKIHDFLMSLGVKSFERHKSLVMEIDGQIAGIVGFEIANSFAATQNEPCFKISLKP